MQVCFECLGIVSLYFE